MLEVKLFIFYIFIKNLICTTLHGKNKIKPIETNIIFGMINKSTISIYFNEILSVQKQYFDSAYTSTLIAINE
jgi:hypothetical protein